MMGRAIQSLSDYSPDCETSQHRGTKPRPHKASLSVVTIDSVFEHAAEEIQKAYIFPDSSPPGTRGG